jgi:single-strand DNA-binding protein
MSREHISDATLVGRLGQKPELGETGEGIKYAKFAIATSERYTDREGEIREKTEWTRAVAWGPLAEQVAERFDKGVSVLAKGAMRINSYEQDGAKHRTVELHVDSIEPNLDRAESRNEARLLGVVRSIEAKTFESGMPMTVVSLGTTTKQNGKDREDWHSVTLWNRTAEAASKEINVGDQISVNGAIRHRSVPTPEGVQRHLSAVDARQFLVVERAQERKQETPPREKTPDRAADSPPRTRGRQRGKNVERDM